MTTSLADWRPDVRTWLRTHPDLAPLHGGRVFLRMPDRLGPTPFCRMYRVGGPSDPLLPFEQPRLSIEVWGRTFSDWPAVRQLEVSLLTVLRQAENVVSGKTLIANAHVTSSADLPDPDTGWPRMVITADLIVRLAQPA